MDNIVLPEIMLLAEKHLKQWLADNGYADVSSETLHVNEVVVKATGKIENILVQVKSFLHPGRPYKLSEYEVDRLIRRANKLKVTPYAAYLVFDDNGNLMGEIKWERLS